jgi:hypothetical protein
MGFLDDVFDECREELQITPRAKTPKPRKKRSKPRAAAPRRDARVHVAPEAPPPRVHVAPAEAAPPPSVMELPRSPSPLRRRGNKIPTSPSKIPRDGTAPDAELVKHANRLASVAASLDSLDLEALARAHQGQGASGITAAAAAAAALNSAIACAVSGEGPEEVRRKLERRSRAVQRAEGIKSKRQADLRDAQRRRDALTENFEARAAKASERKMHDRASITQNTRARRESTQQAAANRRDLAAARKRLGYKDGVVPQAPSLYNPYASFLPPGATFDDDPLLKRARALRDTAAQITADLGGAPAAPVVVEAPPPQYEVPTEEAELVARAKALLADYDPQPARQKPSNFEYGQLVNARRRRADAMRGARAIGR